MKTRQVLGYAIVFLILLTSAYSALGLTASIGNARVILYPNMEEGKSTIINRTVQVNNVNDIPLKITLTPMGDLENQTEIIDTDFIIQPNESINARFAITVPAPGSYETKIGVNFHPVDGTMEDGVGLVSTIIIQAKINQTTPTNSRTNHTQAQPETNPVPSLPLILGIVGGLIVLVIIILIVKTSKNDTKKEAKSSKPRGKRRK